MEPNPNLVYEENLAAWKEQYTNWQQVMNGTCPMCGSPLSDPANCNGCQVNWSKAKPEKPKAPGA